MTERSVDFPGALVASSDPPEIRIPITVVIPTLNESGRLAQLLPALGWADDVIVVDGGSTDDTTSIARNAGARVLELRGQTIGAQRNAGIETARHQWILALDADEMVTSELRDELARLAKRSDPTITAYRVRSRNWYLGRELRYGPWGQDWKTRVFTASHRFGGTRVHENLVAVDHVGTLDGTLLHWPYRDLAHHVAKSLTYTRWAADDLRGRGRVAGVSDVVLRPWWRFTRDYFILSGWRDGLPGFIAAVVSAFYVFLKYATLRTDSRSS
jgi:glycosyltransferase involved in cell wall biosynthesis